MPPKRTPKSAEPKAATAKTTTKPRGRPTAAKTEAAATDKKAPSTKKSATTATTAKKASQSKKPLQEAKANTSAKRKADADLEEKPQGKKAKQTESTTPTKKQRDIKKPSTRAPKPAPAPKPPKKKVVINTAPTTRLDVFAFGTNSNAELGMGTTFQKADCPRPKFNTVLSDAGVVEVSAGGMHGVALTHDNKVLTWGVNDQGALGRNTDGWEGGVVDMEKAEDSDSDEDAEIEVNPKEATPTSIDLSGVESGTVFTQVVAADSASFALTDEGLVYGWGTFRVSILDFTKWGWVVC